MSLQKYWNELNNHLKRIYATIKTVGKFNIDKLRYKKIKFSWRLWHEFITEDDYRKDDYIKFNKKYPFVMQSVNFTAIVFKKMLNNILWVDFIRWLFLPFKHYAWYACPHNIEFKIFIQPEISEFFHENSRIFRFSYIVNYLLDNKKRNLFIPLKRTEWWVGAYVDKLVFITYVYGKLYGVDFNTYKHWRAFFWNRYIFFSVWTVGIQTFTYDVFLQLVKLWKKLRSGNFSGVAPIFVILNEKFNLRNPIINFLKSSDFKWFKAYINHLYVSLLNGLVWYIIIEYIYIWWAAVVFFNFAQNRQPELVFVKRINASFFYKHFKTIIIPLVLSLMLGYILIIFYSINFLKNLSIWIVIGLLFFWLMSGFNFFLKKYRFGKFTSSIQRFWKRVNSYFWFIEGFLFILFFYYYLNSSQETFYMFDESNLNQNHLVSLPSFYVNSLLLIILIMYGYYILLNLPSFNFKQLLTHLTVITAGLVFIFLVECYQFYYILTLFFEINWSYNEELKIWELISETPRLRVKQQYFILALIAKYWHFLFIFFSWLFFVFKSYEQKRIYYNMFGVNLQNLLLLHILNLLFLSNWIKWLFRRYYDAVYYWFFTDVNNWTIANFFSEVVNFLFKICVNKKNKLS